MRKTPRARGGDTQGRAQRGRVGPTIGVLAGGEDPTRHRLLEPGGLVLLERVQVVQTAQEEQVGDLLNHLEWIGDAAGPERVPYLVDLALDGAGDHVPSSKSLI